MRTAVLFVLAAFTVTATELPPPAAIKVDFETHIQPLLVQKCHSCHGRQVQQAGLRLDRRQPAMRGGVYGPVILPGDSAGSKLIRRLVSGDGGLQMPPTGPLSNDEIGLLRAWIDQGADFRIEIQDEAPAKPLSPKLAALLTAVRSTDAAKVASLLAADPPLINAADPTGSTPLHHAAGFGTPAIVKLLLDRGANPNAANHRKSTPLFWGIWDQARVRLLLDHGADPNARTVDGLTPVYQAASLGDGLPVLRLLLSKGANADRKTVTGARPLFAAARRGNVSAMRLLIAAGADVHAPDAAGSTALMAAAASGNTDALSLLLNKGADPDTKTKRNRTALADAATAGNEKSLALLLQHGAAVDVQDERGYTALLYAAGSDLIPAGIVKLLLSKGANPELKGDGETAAMLAAKRGNTAVTELLGAAAEQPATLLPTSVTQRPVSTAITAGLKLLEQQSHNFIRIGGCNSCHAQDLPSAAAALARSRGVPAPASIPQLPPHMHANTAERLMDLVTIGISGVGISWELFDLGMNDTPRDAYTDASIRYLKAMQNADGSWAGTEGRRPPMIDGAHQSTALAIYALDRYGPAAESADTRRAIQRAAAWLETNPPDSTQDRVFRLLGLAWANAPAAIIAAAAKDLAATQRDDGGWNQLPAMPSDAYATGQALYALLAAGKLPRSHPAAARGVQYLLRTQAPDGSWFVKSRSIWIQPYFESGFPYGHDQWISAAGTAWASLALAQTLPPRTAIRRASR